MTRKHYVFIADVLRDIKGQLHDPEDWMLVVLAFKAALARNFRNFNQDRFLAYVRKDSHGHP